MIEPGYRMVSGIMILRMNATLQRLFCPSFCSTNLYCFLVYLHV